MNTNDIRFRVTRLADQARSRYAKARWAVARRVLETPEGNALAITHNYRDFEQMSALTLRDFASALDGVLTTFRDDSCQHARLEDAHKLAEAELTELIAMYSTIADELEGRTEVRKLIGQLHAMLANPNGAEL